MEPMKQAVPTTIGGALGVVWMVYGEWLGLVPPDLDTTQALALTGAVGVLGATLVNLIRLFLPKGKPDA